MLSLFFDNKMALILASYAMDLEANVFKWNLCWQKQRVIFLWEELRYGVIHYSIIERAIQPLTHPTKHLTRDTCCSKYKHTYDVNLSYFLITQGQFKAYVYTSLQVFCFNVENVFQTLHNKML